MKNYRLRTNTRHIVYFMLGMGILYGDYAVSQTIPPTSVSDISLAFWFKAALSGMLAILIWVAKGADARIEKLELGAAAVALTDIGAYARLAVVEKDSETAKHEAKQMTATIALQRELMLTKYADKEETNKHRVHVEDILRKQHDTLVTISHRLDIMARPFHRAGDDKENVESRERKG